ncbi:hypothetical protein CLV42_111127 [Chitinophaga ginsengisoli]|uniref:Uncharacterized protein n=1 Tax=Chitinophaga ginsengisoli TaxID=363837 RepID=A0A2P8FXM4_9BACT|nr:hypothetical protein CLV42_111127 [Chitinophaga ginsengisoli]
MRGLIVKFFKKNFHRKRDPGNPVTITKRQLTPLGDVLFVAQVSNPGGIRETPGYPAYKFGTYSVEIR